MATKNTKKGFTLIELLVVISIIGILSGVVIQNLMGARQKSQNVTRLANIDQIAKALELYITNAGVGALYPTSGKQNEFRCIGLTTIGAKCWGGAFSAPSATESTAANNINLALIGNITSIPKDPVIATGPGDYYLYGGNLASDIPGAYLFWLANNFGSNSCGRGMTVGNPKEGDVFRMCALFLGK